LLIPPRDAKKKAPFINNFANHLNKTSSSDLNTGSQYLKINVNPSPSSSSQRAIAAAAQFNPFDQQAAASKQISSSLALS
jgi:hypothetical protein